MDLALFDLDNTLLSTDSDFEWAQFLIQQGTLDRITQETKNQEFYEQYKAGTLDIHAFLDFQLRPLARHDRMTLDSWHTQFMTTHILPHITPAARSLIERHRAEQAVLAIVTATNSFVTGPIARALGIPHLIATIPAQNSRNGQYTGKPHGIPSFREGKIKRVEAWLEAQGLWWGSFTRSYFYSDSHNDLPLLECVSHPVAVDPDETLRAQAMKIGWPIISLR